MMAEYAPHKWDGLGWAEFVKSSYIQIPLMVLKLQPLPKLFFMWAHLELGHVLKGHPFSVCYKAAFLPPLNGNKPSPISHLKIGNWKQNKLLSDLLLWVYWINVRKQNRTPYLCPLSLLCLDLENIVLMLLPLCKDIFLQLYLSAPQSNPLKTHYITCTATYTCF